jgi:hypothetical protein
MSIEYLLTLLTFTLPTYFTYLHTAYRYHGFVQTAKTLVEDCNKTPSFQCYSSLEGKWKFKTAEGKNSKLIFN